MTAERSAEAFLDDPAEVWRSLPAPESLFRPRAVPGGRHLQVRPGRRRGPAVPAIVGAGVVLVALFALAVTHALLIMGQLRLDDLGADAVSEAEAIRRLQLEVATLESPERVLEAARSRLGMVEPEEVGYLAPLGVPGEIAPTRVPAAEAPEPEPVVAASDDETDATTTGADADQAEPGRSGAGGTGSGHSGSAGGQPG